MGYKDVQLLAPDSLKNKHPNSSVLIISSGHSTKQILNRKGSLKNKFDIIIVVNYAFQFFDDIADYHLVVEKTSKSTKNNYIHRLLKEGNFNTKMPRIINWKGIDLYESRYNILKTTRNNFNGKPNVREYVYNGHEGLLTGPASSQGFGLGSVTLSAMHLAGIMGVSNIYLIGSEFVFKDNFDHFYPDRMYRDDQHNVKSASNRHIIIEVPLNNNVYKTTKYFYESAQYMDQSVKEHFEPNGIKVFDFSDGLITNAKRLNIDEFLK